MFNLFNKNKYGLFSYYNLEKLFLSFDEEKQHFFKNEILKCFVDLDDTSFSKNFSKNSLPEKTNFVIKLSKRLSNKKEFSLSTSLLEFASDNSKDNIEKHLYLNELIETLYKQRDEELFLDKCKNRCLEDISLIKKKKVSDSEPISFKRLAIILESEGNVNDAINLSKEALKLGLHDGTKSGYEGRIEKLSN